MGTQSTITADMIQDAINKLEDVGQKHSDWLGEHIDDIVEIIKAAPDDDTARRDFVAFCQTSPFDDELRGPCRLIDFFKKAGIMEEFETEEGAKLE